MYIISVYIIYTDMQQSQGVLNVKLNLYSSQIEEKGETKRL